MKEMCVLQANCQGHMIGMSLMTSASFNDQYEIVFAATEEEAMRQDLSKAVLLLYQYSDHPRKSGYLTTLEMMQKLPNLEIAIRLPKLRAGFLYPYFYWTSKYTERVSEAGLLTVPYVDKYILDMLMDGVSVQEAAKRWTDLDISKEFDLEKTLEVDLYDMDKNSDILVSDYVRNNFRDKMLFTRICHYGLDINKIIITRILKILGMNTEFDVSRYGFDFGRSHHVPIHPSIVDFFNLKFVDKDSKYYYESSQSFTFQEYVNRWANHYMERGVLCV